MWSRLLELRNSITKATDNKGHALIWGVALGLALTAFAMLYFEKYTLDTRIDRINSDITAALTATADAHLLDSHPTLRDGTSGARLYTGTVWREVTDPEHFLPLLADSYRDASVQGQAIVIRSEGEEAARLSNIRLQVQNPAGGDQQAVYRLQYDLTVPLDLFWKGQKVLLRNQVQYSRYMERYD